MLDIQWKGKIGYGDIVSPICYAHNVSFKYQIPVTLTFRWEWGFGRKIHPSDPEQLWLRASYLFSKAFKKNTNVTLINKFKNPLDCNHTGYIWEDVADDKFHNYWITSFKRKAKKGVIVVNSTEGNIVSLKDYGKSWKDPVGPNWRNIISELKKNYRVYTVDYRTPIDTLCNLLIHSECFIGYHGTAAWIAKYLETPSIIYSAGGTLTKNSFHSSIIIPKYKGTEFLKDNLNTFIQNARLNIESDRESYKKYKPTFKIIG
jgi:hypothetical protein